MKLPFSEYDPNWRRLSPQERVALPAEAAQAYDLYTLRNEIRKSPFNTAKQLSNTALDLPHTRLTSDACAALIDGRLYRDPEGSAPGTGICAHPHTADETHPYDTDCPVPGGAPVLHNLIIVEPPRHGKAIADSEMVWTTVGWKRHGDLVPGDIVFSPKGAPVRVQAVSPPTEASVEVVFSWGRTIKCHPRHEWAGYDRGRKRERVLETQEIPTAEGRSRFIIPEVSPLGGKESDLPVDPYTLGAWLGDGTSSAPLLCGSEGDLQHYQRFLGLQALLKGLGVWQNKHIPVQYLLSSESQRRELLSGLIDTDGSLDKTGRVVFVGGNERLVRDVAHLARTLGYQVGVSVRMPKNRDRVIQDKNPMWAATWTPHDGAGGGTLPRKSARRAYRRRKIGVREVRPALPEPARCIQVEGGMYLVGEHLIPTHNSFIVSENLPVTYLLRNPDDGILLASYEADIAADWGGKCRESFTKLSGLFGLGISTKTKARDHWKIEDRKGFMYTTGAGGPVTGKGGGLLIGDDLIKNAEEANSETIRKKKWEWLISTFLNRTGRPGVRTKRIIMHTRWHESDPVGKLLETQPERWYHLHLEAICTDPGRDPLQRPEGAALAPELVPLHDLEDYRDTDSYWFSALYQGRPVPAGAGIFKEDSLRYHSTRPDAPKYYVLDQPEGPELFVRKEDCYYFVTVDLAVSTKTQADWSVFCVWAVTPPLPPKDENSLLLVAMIRKRLESADHVPTTKNLIKLFPQEIRYIAIEAKQVKEGASLVSYLRREPDIPSIRELEADTDKLTRSLSASALWDQGRFYAPRNATWLPEWLHEHMIFNKGTYDDMVDNSSYAARLFEKHHRNYRREADRSGDSELQGRRRRHYARKNNIKKTLRSRL